MKIFHFINLFFCWFLASNSLAQTSGNYYSYDVKTAKENRSNIDKSAVNETVGVSYKHAFGFDSGLFLAPGVNYERASTITATQSEAGQQSQLSVKNKYDAKLDVGYDATKHFSPYLTGGVTYKSSAVYSGTTIGDPVSEFLSGNKSGYFYGVGTVGKVTDNFNLGVEYNAQNPNPRTNPNPDRVDVYKMNASFKF